MKIDNIYIINLDKDKLRLNKTINQCKKTGIKPTRISGIYGANLLDNDMLSDVDYIYSKIGSKSSIGCAMSHIKAWKTLIKNGNSSALILEDDIIIDDNFISIFNKLKIPEDYYIIYLGCTQGCDINKEYTFEHPLVKFFLNGKKVIKINENVYIPSIPLALHGYILSNKGAKYLIDCLKKNKINGHIDAQIIKYIKDVPSYAIQPQLIKQEEIDLNTSNNIGIKYPYLLNKYLSRYKDKWGVPFDYKLNINLYNISGYNVNGYTLITIIVGIILALSKIDIKYITGIYVLFNIYEYIKTTDKSSLIKNIIGTYIVLLASYYSIAILPNLIKATK